MNTRRSTPSTPSSTLIEIARRRAFHQIDRYAYTFLIDGETNESHLTYGALDRQARAIGAVLQNQEIVGERALLLYPPGLDYITAFFGCLYGGVVAVPAYPPNPARLHRTLPRLRALVDDARPIVVLTTASLLAISETLLAQVPDFPSMTWLATDTIADNLAEEWRDPGASSDSLAFLQYTSGSTALPKGVMLTHSNLVHNSILIHQSFGHTSESRGVIWLPPYHDMGLIGGILQPLYSGFPVTLMSPVDFLQRPFRWLQAISRTRATTSGGPNFAYDLCVRKITPEQRATLDLSSWNLAFNGAEPIHPETLERFLEAFAPCGFRREAFFPCYGLAEATLIVSGGNKADPPFMSSFQQIALETHRVAETTAENENNRTLIGCGPALLDQQIAIVDPTTGTRCRADQVGEIWVAGPSIAKGYWRQPEETARIFEAHLADTGEGPFLRTGDLGFLRNDELFVTGRLKDLIIIRGRNYYPQDIELTIEHSHPALRPGGGAAFSIEVSGEERLVVVHEVDRLYRNIDVNEVAEAIRQGVVAQHELHVYAIALIRHGSITKTSSGKIQRHACRDKFLNGDLDLVGSSVLKSVVEWTSESLSRDNLLALRADERQARLEAYLQAQLGRVLKVPTCLDPHQPVSSLGLDSLMAVELQYHIENDLGVVVSMARFFEDTTIAQLEAQILTEVAASAPPMALEAVQGSVDEYPLSLGQQAIWFLQQLVPESAAYNIVSAMRVQGDLDVPALQRAFQALVDRHPSLRTIFVVRHGQPVQRILTRVAVCFRKRDALTWSEEALFERLLTEAHHPFDLERGPLLRVDLFKLSDREHILLLVVHHIVADLLSLATLAHELGMLYPSALAGRALALPPPRLRYVDYVRWQQDLLAGLEGERLWAYWRQQLDGGLPALHLPTDRPRPAIQTFAGAMHAFKLNDALTRQIKAMVQATGTTLYMALLATFQVLLYRYTGQEEFLVGSPTSGRSRSWLADIVGYFVNPVVLQANLSGNPTFATLLKRVRKTVQGALAHQEYPFALLVERLQPERDPSRSPLFQVMFVLQQTHIAREADLAGFALGDTGARLHIDRLLIESLMLEQRATQFDLMLMMADMEEGLAGSLHYNTDLFDAATVVSPGAAVLHARGLPGAADLNPTVAACAPAGP